MSATPSADFVTTSVEPHGVNTPQVDPQLAVNAPPPAENVGKGLILACLGIVLGVLLSAVIWSFGFIASISTLVMAVAGIWLYGKGSGGVVRRGVPALIGLVVVGVVLSVIACFSVELYQAYDVLAADGQPIAGRFEFITANLVNPKVYTGFGKELAFMVGFAALGSFSTLRRAMQAR